MYTIFFTINCVEQLTFSKTFVDQLQFEQSLICCLKVKLLENNFYYTYGRWVLIFNQFSLFLSTARRSRPVFLSYQISSSWISPGSLNWSCKRKQTLCYFATVRMLMYLKRMTPKHCFQTIFFEKISWQT